MFSFLCSGNKKNITHDPTDEMYTVNEKFRNFQKWLFHWKFFIQTLIKRYYVLLLNPRQNSVISQYMIYFHKVDGILIKQNTHPFSILDKKSYLISIDWKDWSHLYSIIQWPNSDFVNNCGK